MYSNAPHSAVATSVMMSGVLSEESFPFLQSSTHAALPLNLCMLGIITHSQSSAMVVAMVSKSFALPDSKSLRKTVRASFGLLERTGLGPGLVLSMFRPTFLEWNDCSLQLFER